LFIDYSQFFRFNYKKGNLTALQHTLIFYVYWIRQKFFYINIVRPMEGASHGVDYDVIF
jgi:hypothetical protein